MPLDPVICHLMNKILTHLELNILSHCRFTSDTMARMIYFCDEFDTWLWLVPLCARVVLLWQMQSKSLHKYSIVCPLKEKNCKKMVPRNSHINQDSLVSVWMFRT